MSTKKEKQAETSKADQTSAQVDALVIPPMPELLRCFNLRCNAKRGFRLHPDDEDFCKWMWEKYPAWYKATERDVFEATKPYGAV